MMTLVMFAGKERSEAKNHLREQMPMKERTSTVQLHVY
jgi:hypothetical protein